MTRVYRGVLFNEECRFYLGDFTELLNEVNQKTTYSPTAIAALGRSLMITSILGLMEKDGTKVTTIIDGQGPIGKVICNANSKGEVKAKVSNPLVNPQKINDTKLNVGAAVGANGGIRVIKDLNLKEPFITETPLISGEIGIDYANYFVSSEQIPTAIAVGVLVDKDHSIKNASCLIVQAMPEASEETLVKLETFFASLTSISDVMHTTAPKDFLEDNFKNEYEILSEENVSFQCDCSYDKFKNALKLLPVSDIIELKQEEEVECTCDFCYKVYNIKSEEL